MAARYWLDEKLEGTTLSTYKDRDIAAIGLLLYTFHMRGAAKDTDSRFSAIVEPFVETSGGVFCNFFTSLLVGLALRLSFAFHFLVGLMIRGQFQDEAETIVYAWTSFKDHYRELIFFPAVVAVLTVIFR